MLLYCMLNIIFTLLIAMTPLFHNLETFNSNAGIITKTWTTNEGLPVNAVSGIVKDNQGYIWIASYNGLARFDGLNFTLFDNKNIHGVQSNRFHGVVKDTEKNIWFFPEYGGILRYSDSEFIFYDESNGFYGEVLTKPIVIHEGLPYFSTQNGLYRFVNGNFETVFYDQNNIYNYVKNISFFNEMILVSTLNGVILLKNGEIILEINPENQSTHERGNNTLFNNYIYTIQNSRLVIYDLNGNIVKHHLDTEVWYSNWILSNTDYLFLSTNEGLIIYDASNDLNPSHYFPEYYEKFLNRFEDRFGNTWLRDNLGRLYIFDGSEIAQFNPEGILDDHRVFIIMEDTYSLWIGTENKGLIKLSDSVVHTIRMDKDQISGNMMNVFKDSEGYLWSGVRMSGLVRVDPTGNIERITSFMGVPLYDILSITEDSCGTIYFHVNNAGIGIIRPNGDEEIINLSESNPNIAITGIEIWNSLIVAISFNGLFVFDKDGNKLQHVTAEHGLRSERLQKLRISPSGVAWVATIGGGVSSIDLNTWSVSSYNINDGLALNNVRGIYIDEKDEDIVWFATEGNGLSRFHNGKFKNINDTQGLFDNNLHSIIKDEVGRMWMSTNRGIFYVYEKDLVSFFNGETSFVSSVSFNRSRGMVHEESNGGNSNSVFLAENGNLYYPTQAGIAVFDTNNERLSPAVDPVTLIETVRTGNSTIPARDSIVLKPGQNDFTINFTGIEFVSPETVSFKYKLEGYDKEWKIPNGTRSATYTNLPPRNYRFVVKSSLNRINGSANYASVDISLLPRFYQQTWFHIFVFILLIFSVYQTHRMLVLQMQIRERKLEHLVYKRTRDLEIEKKAVLKNKLIIQKQADELSGMNQAKDRFFNIIAHDLKGPVAGVNGLLKMIHENYESLSETEKKELIGYSVESTENVYDLLENLLNWARLQGKARKTELVRTEPKKLVCKSIKVLKPVAEAKSISLQVNSTHSVIVEADLNMFDTIIRNLVSNAIKFSYPESVIEIDITVDETSGYSIITVKDQGMGISKEDQEKLFKIDTTLTKPGTEQEKGTGLGLIICLEMARAMCGNIEVESEVGKGTTFSLKLPYTEIKKKKAVLAEVN